MFSEVQLQYVFELRLKAQSSIVLHSGQCTWKDEKQGVVQWVFISGVFSPLAFSLV